MRGVERRGNERRGVRIRYISGGIRSFEIIHYKMKNTQCNVCRYPLQSIYAQCNVSIYLAKRCELKY